MCSIAAISVNHSGWKAAYKKDRASLNFFFSSSFTLNLGNSPSSSAKSSAHSNQEPFNGSVQLLFKMKLLAKRLHFTVLALATNGASALDGRLLHYAAPNCVTLAGVGSVTPLPTEVSVLPTGKCTIIEPTTTTPFLSYIAYQRDFPPPGQACAILVFADTICNTTIGAPMPHLAVIPSLLRLYPRSPSAAGLRCIYVGHPTSEHEGG